MTKKTKTQKTKDKSVIEDKYTKEQIVKSKRFANYVDLLNATLKDDQRYTLEEVSEVIENYMKGKVN